MVKRELEDAAFEQESDCGNPSWTACRACRYIPRGPLSFPCPIQPTLPIAQRTLWRLFPSRDPLITNWQRELKDGSPGRICLRHQPSSVSFNNRSADRQPHAQALRLSRIKRIEKTVET